MRAVLLPVILLAASVGFASGAVSDQPPPPAGDLAEATAAYLRDPAGTASVFIDAARRHSGELNTLHVLLLSDAAMRTGQVEVARDLVLDLQQSTVDPAMGGMLEMVLAWTALLQGRLAEASTRLDAAVALNPALRSVADPAIGLVASARGLRDGPAMLAAAGARPDLDPAWREIAPLLDAYARYWQGDQAGASDAFTAFAVSSPGSRFADDAVYAAARAKRRAGRTAEAEADLLALAGDEPAPPGIPHRLVALDARALLRDGVRRDRGLGHRTLGQRFADLLDGDGVALARAALAPSRRGRSTDPKEANPGAPAGEAGPQGDGLRGAAGASTTAATTRSRVTPGDVVPSHTDRDAARPGIASAQRAGWRWLGAVAAGLLLALALRRITRRRPGAV